MKRKKRNEISLWNIISVMFPKMFKTCPGLFVLSSFTNIVTGISMGVLIWLSQELYDVIINALAGSATRGEVISIALVFGGVTIGSHIVNGLSVFVMRVMFDIIIKQISYDMHKKAARLEPISFENSNIYDQVTKAIQGKNESIGLLFVCFTPFTCHLPLYIFIMYYFYTLKPSFVLMIFLIFVPICVSYINKMKAKAVLVDASAEPKREMEYYRSCIVDRQYFKETRLLGAVGFFYDLYQQALDLYNSLELKYKTKNAKIDFIAKSITLLGYGCVLYMLFTSVLKGNITVGAFAAVLSGIDILFNEMKELVSDDIGENVANLSSIRSLIAFYQLPEEPEATASALLQQNTIHVRDVSFRYPNSEFDVLKNISLDIHPGEKIAIVGANGSGKTTLTKLLLGFYQPTKGRITVGENGESSRDIRLDASAVFQDYKRYKMTLRENISISDTGSQVTDDHILDAVRKADISEKEDLDVNLSVEFGGIDLSGGQWQRIAIARGLYRNHNFIVLDEPTASIDPIEESNIYRKFIDIIQDKAAILVTHRIGAAKIADRIVVIDNGEYVDSGTHQELMNRCEIYSKMYHAQADWY